MHTSKHQEGKQSTQRRNKALLKQKRNCKRGKRRPSKAVASMLCVATTACVRIPVVKGFTLPPIGINPIQRFNQSKPRKNHVAPSDLSYRSHDMSGEEQQCQSIVQHEQATAKLRRTNQPKHHVSNFIHTWWTSAKSKRALEQAEAFNKEQEREQRILDNYLESIDRRYKRLRNVKSRRDPDSMSSAWQFLMQGDSYTVIEEQRKQEDALYVLGLADLASKRLLQKHHLPIPQSKRKDKSVIIDIKSSVETLDSPAATIGTEVSGTFVRPRADVARKLLSLMLLCFQFIKTMQKAFTNHLALATNKCQTGICDSLKASGKFLTTLANMVTSNSGGKYAIHFLSIFATTLVASAIGLFRPLTRA